MGIFSETEKESFATRYGSSVLPGSDVLLTVREVAQLLKVPVSWVYDHARADCHNPLPHIKVGKYLRFLASDIVGYLDEMRRRNCFRR